MLSELEACLHDLLAKTENVDVNIAKLYNAAYPTKATYENRFMQQRIAPIIARVNKKLPEGHRIEPGKLKRTYRLNTNYKA